MIVFVALCNEIDDLCEEVTGCSRLHAMGAHCCRSCAPRAHAAWGPSQLRVARHAFHACAQCKGGGFVLTVQAKAKFYAPLLLYGEGEASENIEDGDAQVRIGRMLPFLQVCVCVCDARVIAQLCGREKTRGYRASLHGCGAGGSPSWLEGRAGCGR